LLPQFDEVALVRCARVSAIEIAPPDHLPDPS
jgi:hypothetical protein